MKVAPLLRVPCPPRNPWWRAIFKPGTLKGTAMNRLKLMLSVAGLACAGAAVAVAAPPAAGADAGPAAMAGRIVTREEAKAGAEALFARLDLNKDGKLDAADRAEQVGRMFDRLDADHDGKLTRAEFIAAHTRTPDAAPPAGPDAAPGMGMGRAGMRARAMGMGMMIMREADPQRSGTVTHDAFINAALAVFDKSDTNRDGKVTPEERRAAMPGRGGMPGMGAMGDRMRGMPGMGAPMGEDMPPPPPGGN